MCSAKAKLTDHICLQAQRAACAEALGTQDALNASLGSMLEAQDDQYVRMLKGGGAEVEALLRALAQQSEEANAVCSVQLQRMEATFEEVRRPAWVLGSVSK